MITQCPKCGKDFERPLYQILAGKKTCSECKNIYQREWFKKHPGYRQKYNRKVIEMTPAEIEKKREKDRRYHESHKDYINRRRRDNRKTDAGREALHRYDHTYRNAHPNKMKARKAVNRAIEAGKFPPLDGLSCRFCDNQAAHYHHWNGYGKDQWLDVIPVCLTCHSQLD